MAVKSTGKRGKSDKLDKLKPFQGVILLPSWAKVVTREFPIKIGTKIIVQTPRAAKNGGKRSVRPAKTDGD